MADYPRELLLDSDTGERLISYIESELMNHYAERGGHVDDLMRWQKDYWATPFQKEATFPFKGAAIIIVPLSAIAIEAVHARTMTMTFGLPHFVSAHAIATEWTEVDRAVERFLDYELMYNIKIRKPLNDCFLEATKFGTMIGKVGYEKQVKFAVRQLGENMEEVFPVVVKDGAVVDAVPDARFLMPYYAKDPQLSPWVGEEHSTTAYEVMTLEQAGMFRSGTIISDDPDPNVNNSMLGAWVAQAAMGTAETGREFEENQERLENTEPSWPEKIEWVELWLSFDVDGSRQEKEIVVHYHRPSRTFMSVRYNWNIDLSRPYRTGVYFPIEHRWRGIGICKKNEQFQREVTTQHRQRLDNATLANMRMIVVHKLSGYGPREPVFPGKMWFVDDMTHVQTLQMGDVYNSSYANEQATLLYSQQRTGVNEVTLGMPQVGTPGTATSDLARIQEGNKKFDFIYANFREFVEEIIVDVAATIQQFGPRKLRYFETTENGRLVADFFQMPEAHIRDGLLIQLKMAGQQQNKILDRQNWQQIAAHLQAYYTGLTQLAMPLGDPALLQLIFTKGIGAATEAMRQILESFDIRNIDRIVLTEIEEMMNNGPNAAGPGAGGNIGPTGATPVSPIDQLAQAFSPFENGGVPGSNRLLGR